MVGSLLAVLSVGLALPHASRPSLPRASTPVLCTGAPATAQPFAILKEAPPPSTPSSDPFSQTEALSTPSSGVTNSATLSVGCARALLAGVAAIYGTNYAAVKVLDEAVGDPAMVAVVRFALCVALLLPLLGAAAVEHPRVVRWPLARDGLECGFWFALGCASRPPAHRPMPTRRPVVRGDARGREVADAHGLPQW